MDLVWIFCLLSMAALSVPHSDAAPAPESPRPPVARKVPKVTVLHGERRVDDYFWLREKANPDVAAYLEAENAYTDAVIKPTLALQETLYQEMVGHIKETDLTVPFRDGNYFYYQRTEQGEQYPILCRKKGALESPEEIYLNLNELAKGQKFLGLGALDVSDNGSLLAYTTDFTGFREYTLHVKDLRTGNLFPERMEKTGSVAWANDNATLFYTIEDAAKRQYRLYRHRLGADPARNDELVYEEKDERFNIQVGRSRSKAYLFLSSGSHTTSEWRYLAAHRPEGEWRIIEPRRQDHEYSVDHHGDRFFIRTNDRGRNFRLVSAPVDGPGKENWEEVIPHRPGVMLSGLEMFANYYALLERQDGLPRVRVTDFRSGESLSIEFPEPVYAVFPAQNREYDTKFYRYNYQSMITPSSVYDYDMVKGTSTLLKRLEVPHYDSTEYRTERLWATAPDGVRVPLSLVYREGFKPDSTHPMLLTGYGAYGYPFPISFSSNVLSLLDRGFVYAIAHVRGGGEMGKTWHDQGRMMNKRNTFADFIAAADYLVSQKYTSKDRLVISGTSAGGLLTGAVANMRPDLFKAVILKVPFVDVVNTMSDASLPLTVPEFEEWGNPQKKDEYDYIKTYCPYTNLAAKAYPSMLVKTSFNDSQVMYWEPAKYVAKLRSLKTDANPVLLKTNMAAGHGGASGRYDYLREIAFEYAFMLRQTGKN